MGWGLVVLFADLLVFRVEGVLICSFRVLLHVLELVCQSLSFTCLFASLFVGRMGMTKL